MRTMVLALGVGICCGVVAADEGMWPPGQVEAHAELLGELGLELVPQQLGDLDGDPLGAVVWLGGCTASFVSPRGLLVTNHHCAFGSIQHNSTEERNLLEEGFLAATPEEELPASPGSRVYVTSSVEDVTGRVLGAIPEGAAGAVRAEAIEAAEKELVAACETAEGTRCRVASFFGGMEYRLIRQLELRDVRLVYAPAGAVGNYGGDVDNWSRASQCARL